MIIGSGSAREFGSALRAVHSALPDPEDLRNGGILSQALDLREVPNVG